MFEQRTSDENLELARGLAELYKQAIYQAQDDGRLRQGSVDRRVPEVDRFIRWLEGKHEPGRGR